MTDIVLLLVSILVTWDAFKLDRIEKLLREPKPKSTGQPMVTSANPILTNPNAINQEDSMIVEPKSPQLVQWEEEEQLRKLNIKPR